MKNIIIGTSGHIDHGKTSLVRALTGIDTDRLKEEKQRGITIDIGFAQFNFENCNFGFVDVPGHERFIKNMLAGAHGFDIVMMVVAADEGIMPQTKEHLDICQLLKIQTGLTVITKTDLVDAEYFELIKEETESFLAGSFLDGNPIIPVSIKTGQGLQDLKQTLNQLSGSIIPKNLKSLPRLPIDRIFTVKGFGTVVTGTLVSGNFQIGDNVEIQPSCKKTRIRSMEIYGEHSNHVIAGQRVALNLQNIPVSALKRGQVVVPSEKFISTSMIDVKLELLASASGPLFHQSRVRFHQGTNEVMARVSLLRSSNESEKFELLPGNFCFAQLRLENPIFVLPQDRFIIRSYSPQITIGGGTVLDIQPIRHKRSDPALAYFLKSLSEVNLLEKINLFIKRRSFLGITVTELIQCTGQLDSSLIFLLQKLNEDGKILFIDTSTGKPLLKVDKAQAATLIETKAVDSLKNELIEYLNNFHSNNPLVLGISREGLRHKLFAKTPVEIFKFIIFLLQEEQKIIVDDDIIRLSSHQVNILGTDADIKNQLESLFISVGFLGLAASEAFDQLKSDRNQVKQIYFLLLAKGQLIRIGEFTFHIDIIQKLIHSVKIQKEYSTKLDVVTFKDLFGLSRKYAIPLLEYLDILNITRRVGNTREIL